jgi:hypothetical protein
MPETQMNWFATLVLLSWPVISLWLYKTQPLNRAILWTILGGEFLLPTGALAKLAPGIPTINKVSIPNFAALLGCAFFAGQRVRFFGRIGLAEVLLFMLIGGPFITSILNGDPVITGGIPLPGLTYYDAGSAVEAEIVVLLPFFIGRQFLRNAADIEEILRFLVILELFYSIPTLLEVRLSPQLHIWLYGYAAGDFMQQFRGGGFRPMVFIGHGMITAFFLMTAVAASTALWRARTRVMPGALPMVVTAYLSVVLVLSKSLGALTYAMVLVPLIRLTKPRLQMSVAVVLAIIVLAYPLARMSDLIPTHTLLDWSGSFDKDREESLEFRFVQEAQMLERASQRFIFGWGGYVRGHVFNEWGGDTSVPDGYWIITLGQWGLFGFLATFGLLVLPVFRAAAALRFAKSTRDGVFFAALALMLAINAVDQMPNATITPWTWLLCGAVLGRAEQLRAPIRHRSPAKPVPLSSAKTVASRYLSTSQ